MSNLEFLPTRSSRLVLSLLGLSLLASLLVLASVPARSEAVRVQHGKSKVRKVSVLYALDAASGSLARAGRKGAYKLTLKGLAPNAIWFSDRPRAAAARSRPRASSTAGGDSASPPTRPMPRFCTPLRSGSANAQRSSS